VNEAQEPDEAPDSEEEASENVQDAVVVVHAESRTQVVTTANQAVVAQLANRKYRGTIPEEHCTSIDTKVRWLWNQRFGTVQRVWQLAEDAETKAAATLILNAAYVGDLSAIQVVLNRLEGGVLTDEDLLDFSESMPI